MNKFTSCHILTHWGALTNCMLLLLGQVLKWSATQFFFKLFYMSDLFLLVWGKFQEINQSLRYVCVVKERVTVNLFWVRKNHTAFLWNCKRNVWFLAKKKHSVWLWTCVTVIFQNVSPCDSESLKKRSQCDRKSLKTFYSVKCKKMSANFVKLFTVWNGKHVSIVSWCDCEFLKTSHRVKCKKNVSPCDCESLKASYSVKCKKMSQRVTAKF